MAGLHLSTLIKALAALGVLWLMVWGILHVTGYYKMTPEKVIAYVEANPLDSIDDDPKRREIIKGVADRLNALNVESGEWEEMREQRRNGNELGRSFFENLRPEEQRYFLEIRIGPAFDQMMQAFNSMDPEERRRLVDRTLKDMEDEAGSDRDGLERLRKEDPEAFEKIVSEGVRSYYQEASAETKMDLAPIMERMQQRMRRLR